MFLFVSFAVVTNSLEVPEDFCVSTLAGLGNVMLLDLERIMIPGLDPGLLVQHRGQRML